LVYISSRNYTDHNFSQYWKLNFKITQYGNVSSNIHRRHYSSRSIFDLAQNQIWEEMARKLITLDIYRVIIGGISTIIFIRIGNTILK
jgi:uncharacterized protein YxjI